MYSKLNENIQNQHFHKWLQNTFLPFLKSWEDAIRDQYTKYAKEIPSDTGFVERSDHVNWIVQNCHMIAGLPQNILRNVNKQVELANRI